MESKLLIKDKSPDLKIWAITYMLKQPRFPGPLNQNTVQMSLY